MDQRTPDIASIVQEIVNRPGWEIGNSLVIIITGTGQRTAEAFEGVASATPLLHLEYAVGSNAAPTADFTWMATDLSVAFTDESGDADGTLTAWSWNFGDGGTSTSRNPTHTYATAGDYTVTLTVTDDAGATGNTSQTVSVSAPANQPPTADFTWVATDLSVAFTDESGDADGTLTAWSWNFGDGGTSTSRNPTHAYATAGDYTVTLTVTDDDGATATFADVVSVSEPPTGVTIYDILPSTVPVNSSVTVVISGSGFAPGARLSFENGIGPAPGVSNLDVGETTITATLEIKSGGPRRDRQWDVRVTNPDGSSGVLLDGLTVTSG